MSNFIPAERFQKLDKSVQAKILEWWKPQVGDLVENNIIKGAIGFISETKGIDKECVIPLLVESQLRKYIESNINGHLTIRQYDNGYVIHISTGDKKCVVSNKDILEAYLELAVKISV